MSQNFSETIFGIDYTNIKSPFFFNENKIDQGIECLNPYFGIHGLDFDHKITNVSSDLNSKESTNPLRRIVFSVSPPHPTEVSYSQNPNSQKLLNLDTNQLWTQASNSDFFKSTSVESPKDESLYLGAGTGEGVLDAPTPLRGGPVKFQKVYFRGQGVSVSGTPVGDGERTFNAYFLCSDPIDQTHYASGQPFPLNHRNPNYAYTQDASVSSYDAIDIGFGGGSSCFLPYSGFTGNDSYTGSGTTGSGSGSGSGCGLFTFSGVSGIDTLLSGDTLYISETCPFPYSGFTGNRTHTGSGSGSDSGSGSGSGSGCGLFNFSGVSGIDTLLSGDTLYISETCPFPYSGFTGNRTHTGSGSGSDSGSGSGSGSGCGLFNFSGVSGIDTLLSGDTLYISETCPFPYSGFTGNRTHTGSGSGSDSGSGSGSGSGCGLFNFSGVSGIDTLLSGDTLYISETCPFPYSGFTGNSGSGITGFPTGTGSGSGCGLFTFSGISGIDTYLSGNVLYISGNNCSLPYTGFSGNRNIQTDNTGSGSGCRSFTFSGISGIQTFTSGDALLIANTGSGGCPHAFTGFITDETGFADGAGGSSYNKTGCRDLPLFGLSGVVTRSSNQGVFIGGPRVVKSGSILEHDYDTDTRTHTIGLDRSGILSGLGMEEKFIKFACEVTSTFTGYASGVFLVRNLRGQCIELGTGGTTTTTTTTEEPTGACCIGDGPGGFCLGVMGERECVDFNAGDFYEDTECEDSPCGATTTSTTPLPTVPMTTNFTTDSNTTYYNTPAPGDGAGGGSTTPFGAP